jgi:hypothetical protein
MPAPAPPFRHFGYAWLALCLSLCTHVADEALTGFLPLYNATVRAIRAQNGWFPMPTFDYRDWLFGLIAVNIVLLLLTPLAFRNMSLLRPFAYFFALIMFLNGMGHTLATLFGRGPTLAVSIPRPAPGFYSSPLLLAASVYLFVSLRRSAPSR